MNKFNKLRKNPRARPRMMKPTKKLIIDTMRQYGEKKHKYDLWTITSGPEAGAGVLQPLTFIAQGDGEQERNGKIVKIPYIHINGILTHTTGLAEDIIVRVSLVRVIKPLGGSAPALTTIWDVDSVISPRSHTNMQDYKILKQKYMKMSPNGINGANKAGAYRFEIFKKFKNPLQIRYSGTSAELASADTGHLYLVLQSTQTGGGYIDGSVYTHYTYDDN